MRREATAGPGEELLAFLIERSAELKRDLADFACSPGLQRSMATAMAGLKVKESDAINTIDRFALQYRLPDGKSMVDLFVASRPDLDANTTDLSRSGSCNAVTLCFVLVWRRRGTPDRR